MSDFKTNIFMSQRSFWNMISTLEENIEFAVSTAIGEVAHCVSMCENVCASLELMDRVVSGRDQCTQFKSIA